MKSALQLALVLAALSGAAFAEPPADVRAAPSCPHCGMDREKFAHSRMLVEYEDGIDRASAEAFVKTKGGTLATFEEAMRATYEDLYQDTRAIRERRKMMRARQQGQPMTPAGHGAPPAAGHGQAAPPGP